MGNKSNKNIGLLVFYERYQSILNYLVMLPILLLILKYLEKYFFEFENNSSGIVGVFWIVIGIVIFIVNQYLWRKKWKKEALQYSETTFPSFVLDGKTYVVYNVMVENNGLVNIDNVKIHYTLKRGEIIFAATSRHLSEEMAELIEIEFSAKKIDGIEIDISANTSIQTIIVAEVDDSDLVNLRHFVDSREYKARRKQDDKERDYSTRIVASIILGVGFSNLLAHFI